MEGYMRHLQMYYKAPSKLPKLTANHRFINFVYVDFLEWSNFPYYVEQLIGIIKEQWVNVKKNCDEAAYKYSGTTIPVMSFFAILF